MQVTVKLNREKGFPATISIEVDGNTLKQSFSGSRILTETELELEHGVFEEEVGEIWFERSVNGIPARVYVNFEEPLPTLGTSLSATEFARVLKDRIKAVKEAFDITYPAVDESVTFEV